MNGKRRLNMFLKVTNLIGKPICVLLYAVFGVMAVKKKPAPLLILFILHAAEYVIIGRKTASEHGIGKMDGLLKCLAFGFTWWLPIIKG